MTAAALHNTVRSHGLRVSSARRGVLDRLLDAEQPLTAEELAGGGDVASIYRNLVTLEAIGVVRRLRPARGPSRYVLSERCHTCPACGRSTYI